jgi:hypothetical protein
MMGRDEQKSYNWVYGTVKGMVRMLPFSRPSVTKANLEKHKGTFPQKLGPYLAEVSTELERLRRRTDIAQFARAGEIARSSSEQCFRLDSARTNQEFEMMLNDLIDSLRELLSELDGQTAIRYHLWWSNPRQYYPRKLPN